MLVVMDNGEHVLEAAADVIDKILASTRSVDGMATSWEGLRAASEQLCPVPSLGVAAGVGSAAVELFEARAQAVAPRFGLGDPHDTAAVIEICRRLDDPRIAQQTSPSLRHNPGGGRALRPTRPVTILPWG
jgi:predicted ATPase